MPTGEYLQYGGQAIIEGVMMRSPRFFSIACRAPNGAIVQTTEPIEKTWIGRQRWLKLPFLRGSWALLDAMTLGVKAMRFAANTQMDPSLQPADAVLPEPPAPKSKARRVVEPSIGVLLGLLLLLVQFGGRAGIQPPFGPVPGFVGNLVSIAGVALLWLSLTGLYAVAAGKEQTAQSGDKVQSLAVGATIVVSMAFGLFLFNYVPNMLAEQLRFAGVKSGTVINFATESVKLVFFLGYITLIGQFKEIKEVFKYHGAEHKAINTLEADQALTMENCRLQTRLHPRCGTSFAIIVMLVSFVVSTLTPRYLVTGQQGNWLVDVSARFVLEVVVLLPVISGIAYEMIRVAGKFRNTAFVNALFKPGLMSQYLTTREPEDGQIEVALAALKACYAAEHGRVPADAAVDDNALESAPAPLVPGA